jgi:macrolide-specific efflux system membrane fusion protein
MKKTLWISLPILAIILGIVFWKTRKSEPEWKEIPVESAPFRVNVSAGGTVQPENKIQVNSPINGRMDDLLVEEGKKVRRGQTLAWMSSTDRAALLDSAQAQGAAAIKEWAEVYKPTPILAPTGGQVISRKVVVGQTVTQQTVLFELSDRLIVMADVDETDLGKLRVGQEASVRVDSFPGLEVKGEVARIAHQSSLKNSINTYEVLVQVKDMPKEYRSGLTATVQFLYADKPSALLLPAWISEGRENVTEELQVKTAQAKPETRKVKFGLSNGEHIEVLEGLNAGEILLVKDQLVFNEASKAPFGVMNSGGGRARRR